MAPATSNQRSARRSACPSGWRVRPANRELPAPLLRCPVADSKSVLSLPATIVTTSARAVAARTSNMKSVAAGAVRMIGLPVRGLDPAPARRGRGDGALDDEAAGTAAAARLSRSLDAQEPAPDFGGSLHLLGEEGDN